MNTTTATTRATVAPGYRWRVGLFALLCLGYGAYSLYDGVYRYPWLRQVSIEYEQYQKEGRIARWPVRAKSLGWPEDIEPGKPKEMWNIWFNNAVAVVLLPLGLFFTWWYLTAPGKWIQMNEQGLTTSWGQKTDFSSISSINMLRWKTKGIARVSYQEGGATKRLVLDDWKYTREPIQAMVKAVEGRLRPDQIVGGEPTPKAAEEEAKPGA